MKECCVKDYVEYLKKLKETFGEVEQMPSDVAVSRFILQYDLDKDWRIVVSDVKTDISQEILADEIQRKQEIQHKNISSYKEYLEELRKIFGILKTMPDTAKIEHFIEEYHLEENYGINVNDVRMDLKNFLVKTEQRPLCSSIHSMSSHSFPVSPKKSLPRQKPQVQSSTCRNIQKSESSKSGRNNKKKSNTTKPKTKQKISASQELYLIDGDNNLKEGRKGIEHTTKSTPVIAFFAQKGAKKNFDDKYKGRPNVSSKLVKPGNQAVDNQIKTEAGQLLKENRSVVIISQDKGFDGYIERKKKSGKHISRERSVSSRVKKK